jgi:L-cysteine desulfidase
LPIALVAKNRRIKQEKLARAAVLSFLITAYLKKYSGRLSAFCGCAITAAIGAAVGIVFMLGGNFRQIKNCINNMAGDVTGLLCDGGNFSCSLKCATGASSAVRAALLALEGVGVPDNCGIIGKNVEETIRNMGEISYPGMKKTDEVVVNIISKRI